MEGLDSRKSQSLLARALEQCRSIGRRRRRSLSATMRKSKSWQQEPSSSNGGGGSTRRGCLTVFVGPSRERFVIKMECVSHPLFKELLEEAEKEFEFSSPGPLELPCEVEQFYSVLCEIEQEKTAQAKFPAMAKGGAASTGSYRLLSPKRLIVDGSF